MFDLSIFEFTPSMRRMFTYTLSPIWFMKMYYNQSPKSLLCCDVIKYWSLYVLCLEKLAAKNVIMLNEFYIISWWVCISVHLFCLFSPELGIWCFILSFMFFYVDALFINFQSILTTLFLLNHESYLPEVLQPRALNTDNHLKCLFLTWRVKSFPYVKNEVFLLHEVKSFPCLLSFLKIYTFYK